jgi:anti-anti-sigma factor
LRDGLFVSAARDRDGRRLLSLRVRGDGGGTVVEADGEVDLGTADLLLQCCTRALHENPGPLVLDLSRITFFSAAGLRALMVLRRAAGGRLALRAPSPSVAFVLELTALTDEFAVVETEPEPPREAETGPGTGRRGEQEGYEERD